MSESQDLALNKVNNQNVQVKNGLVFIGRTSIRMNFLVFTVSCLWDSIITNFSMERWLVQYSHLVIPTCKYKNNGFYLRCFYPKITGLFKSNTAGVFIVLCIILPNLQKTFSCRTEIACNFALFVILHNLYFTFQHRWRIVKAY